MGSAHFRSANLNVSDAAAADNDNEVISIAAAVVRIYYALQIDNAASTVPLTISLPSLAPRVPLKMQTNAPTNIACHINWNYKFNLTREKKKTARKNALTKFVFISLDIRYNFHMANREKRLRSSVRKLNESKNQNNNNKNERKE